MTRVDRTKAFFVAFDYTSDVLREIDGFFRKSGKVIVALTVREILDGQLAKKLTSASDGKQAPAKDRGDYATDPVHSRAP